MNDSTSERSRPRFLVLLATRNGAPCVRAQVESVLAQSGVDVRLVVRDDGSSDQTRQIVASMARDDARVTLRADHESSGSAAANFFKLVAGADTADVDFVAFCDQDDQWLPQKLARAATRLRDSGCTGYSAAVQARWPDGRTKVQTQSTQWKPADYLFEGAGQGCTFVFDARLFSRLQGQLLSAASLQSALHYHDWALHALARSAGATWFFDPEPAMIYHQHDGNDTGARSSGAGVRRRLKLIQSGWYRAQVRAIVALVLAANPSDAFALAWLRLDDSPSHSTLRGRLVRAQFIARHGRRKTVDRCIQLAAVAFGYL